jgi:hypothetical protein
MDTSADHSFYAASPLRWVLPQIANDSLAPQAPRRVRRETFALGALCMLIAPRQ